MRRLTFTGFLVPVALTYGEYLNFVSLVRMLRIETNESKRSVTHAIPLERHASMFSFSTHMPCLPAQGTTVNSSICQNIGYLRMTSEFSKFMKDFAVKNIMIKKAWKF